VTPERIAPVSIRRVRPCEQCRRNRLRMIRITAAEVHPPVNEPIEAVPLKMRTIFTQKDLHSSS